MDYETVLLERRGAVALLTLNRPARANAIGRRTLDELQAACDEVEADDGVAALVVTGAGGNFSSGFDLKEQAADPPAGREAWEPVLRRDFDAVMRFWHLPKPTIAAVRGAALAGGFELAMACDVTIAAADARFGEPELRFGAGIVVMLLPWLAGPKRAKEILLAGIDDVGAEEALRMGLVNRVVPAGEEVAAALALGERLARIDPAVLRATKRAVNGSYEAMGMGPALEQALAIDLEIEATGSAVKREFLRLVRERGMAAALAWRDAR